MELELLCDLKDVGGRAFGSFAVCQGVPFSRGQVFDPSAIRVINRQGASITSQRKVLSRWPDESIRWCLIEFVWNAAEGYCVICDAADRNQCLDDNIQLIELLEGCDAGAGAKSGLELHSKTLGQTVLPEIHLRHDGKEYIGVCEKLQSLDSGPIRWSQRCTVRFASENITSPLEGELIANTYANFSVVTFEFVIRNPQAMDHPGGTWDLGATGSVIVEDLSVRFPLSSWSDDSRLSVELSDAGRAFQATKRLTVFQASSGGENWKSKNHLDRHGKVSLEFRGYKVSADGIEHAGLRAEPIMRSTTGSFEAAVACRDFWQNFPKVVEADHEALRIGLFPAESNSGTEIQGGEQKTHQFAFELKPSDSESAIEACLNPPVIKLSPADYARAEALPYLTPRSAQCDQRYESLVDQAIEGDDTFLSKSEAIDQFGWRNFGDIYGDHEAVYHRGDEPMISHYNNQYDCVLGFAIQFFRSGNRRWFDMMTQMADHAWDIDTYHTYHDKLLYNGGLFWHTYHYADAHTSTHRSYPNELRVSQSFDDGKDLSAMGETGEKLKKNYAIGGGPAAAHNYNTGWMVAYWLTGAERYRTAAIAAADYVMRIEDGKQTPFKWLSRANTGYSTHSSYSYYGPGRAAANSTHALLTGHELTSESKYLDHAATLMRRTVHPQEDLEALDLLNAELRWFYTMYLQALGRFVDYKDSLGQHDDDFDYGVAALLHYANWMAKHERPTLSQPEKLQYPTETWAAQDMRKWHVLRHAAQYESNPQLQRALTDKANFFYDDVCDSLSRFESRSLCRPVVLMINFGWQKGWLSRRDAFQKIATQRSQNFPVQQPFIPQRTIAVAKFKKIVALIAAVGLTVSIALLAWMFR